MCKVVGCYGRVEQNIITGAYECQECGFKNGDDDLFEDQEEIQEQWGYDE